MCTSIFMNGMDQSGMRAALLGRTMDFSYPIAPKLMVMPRGHEWRNVLGTAKLCNTYAFMGIGQKIEGHSVFTEGFNEAGFAVAALYFPGYALFDEPRQKKTGKIHVAAVEVAGFLLGKCRNVGQMESLMREVQIIGVADPITRGVAPLHWIAADEQGGCRVMEQTENGLSIMENPLGVLANSPDFSWHMTNLRNYGSLSPYQSQKEAWGGLPLLPFGQAGGTRGLPGDFTPPSRFVRAAFLKTHVAPPENREQAVLQGFHILENVSIPKGVVMTNRGTADYTQYTSVMDLRQKRYYYKTSESGRIAAADFEKYREASEAVSLGELDQMRGWEER